MAIVALIPAAMALIKLISILSSVVFVSSYIRDAATKNTEAEIQKSQDDTVDAILNNTSLSPDQKYDALREYLGIKKPDSGISTEMILLFSIVLIILIAGYFVLSKRNHNG